jgi:hypothetical protein
MFGTNYFGQTYFGEDYPGLPSLDYSYGTQTSLPADNIDLTAFNSTDYSDVLVDDSTYFDLICNSPDYAVVLFKNQATNNSNPITPSWIGKTNYLPSTQTVYLQIYNLSTPGWETIDSNNSSPINTDFTLTHEQAANLSDYYDSNNYVSCRVYQKID